MARRATERGKMKHEDELTIQEHILEIEQEIEAKELTGPLFTKKIIDMEDMESIQAGETRSERARRLLNTILLRGPNSFPAFVDALQVMGYGKLAAKLSGTRSSTQKVTVNVTEREEYSLLNNEISQLKLRVADMEFTRARKTELGELQKGVKDELQKVASTLQTIEDLSRVSRETVTTINTLRSQLDDKDKLLKAARQQIEKLQSKVCYLEDENARIRRTAEKQQKEIQDLKQKQRDETRKTQKKFEELEDKHEKERKKNEERFLKLEADKEKMMSIVANQLAESRVGNIRVNKKPIVPRHRFQKGK